MTTERIGIDRLPPQNLEAERGVLGSIFFDNQILDDIEHLMSPDYFYLDSHRRIYKAIKCRRDEGCNAFDAITIGETLEKAGDLKEIGGYDYLREIIEAVPHAAHAKYYAEMVRDKAFLRRLIFVGSDLVKAGFDEVDPDVAMNEMETAIQAVREGRVNDFGMEMIDVGLEWLHELDSPKPPSVPTGFAGFDAKTGGLGQGNLGILAARPSMGKTALALNFIENIAGAGGRVLFVSLEQSRGEIMERLIVHETGFSTKYLRSRNIREQDRQTIVDAANKVTALPITIADKTPRTVREIGAIGKVIQKRSGLALIVIDYLQLIEAEDKRAPRQEQVAEQSKALKMIARGLSVPVLCLAQLNRGLESREDKRPLLADLRESGAIEQDADVVMFVHRPWMFDRKAPTHEASLLIRKNRNGPIDDVPLVWHGKRMTFVDPPQQHEQGEMEFEGEE